MPLALRRRPPRGLTLVELMVSIVILAIVMAGITRVIMDVYRTQSIREVTSRMQGEGRDALRRFERELRSASLGAPIGVIWQQDAANNVVQRPAVQLFDDLSADGANLKVKKGSDAVLVVGAVGSGAEAAVVGTSYDSTKVLPVSNRLAFAEEMAILVGPYGAASWDVVAAVKAEGLELSGTENLFPDGKAASGSLVRQARASLFYLTETDELVEQELLVPRPPASLAEMGVRHVLARGVENLQLNCELDDGMNLQACAAPLDSAQPEATEAEWAFGTWDAGGPRLTRGNIASLRTVVISVVVRSERALPGQRGDSTIAIENSGALEAGVTETDQPFLRRAYRLPVAVRNVSLGAL